ESIENGDEVRRVFLSRKRRRLSPSGQSIVTVRSRRLIAADQVRSTFIGVEGRVEQVRAVAGRHDWFLAWKVIPQGISPALRPVYTLRLAENFQKTARGLDSHRSITVPIQSNRDRLGIPGIAVTINAWIE
ncbi:MAG: hypothetical protein ACRC1K_18190, partial [Planctomycetia bacterium]